MPQASNDMDRTKSQMTPTEQGQEDEISALRDEIKELIQTLKPISETYRTVTTLGKWGMALLVLVSVCVGIVLGLKNIFK